MFSFTLIGTIERVLITREGEVALSIEASEPVAGLLACAVCICRGDDLETQVAQALQVGDRVEVKGELATRTRRLAGVAVADFALIAQSIQRLSNDLAS